MDCIDITFDFETVAVTANAAPMQLAAVAWDRTAKSHPRIILREFHSGIDLRSCVVNGYDFDQETLAWWMKQKEDVKVQVISERTDWVGGVIDSFLEFISDLKKEFDTDTVYLWCQGADFDLPILKNICRKENLSLPIHHKYFCDARSFVLQNAILLNPDNAEFRTEPTKVYDWIQPVPQSFCGDGLPHNALFDCRRTTWNVWCIMQEFQRLLSSE